MATPLFQTDFKIQTIERGTPNFMSWIVRDAAGDPVDVSAGYTAAIERAPVRGGNTELVGLTGTFAYGADGVISLALTSAQSLVPLAGSQQYDLLVSDDAFATRARAAKGTLTINDSVAGS